MDEFYTVDEAAKLLGVVRQTISKYMREGQLKGFRIGPRGRWKIDKASLYALMHGEPQPKQKDGE